MSDAADSIVLEHLDRISSTVEGLADDVLQARQRMDNIERLVANLRLSKAARIQELRGINERLDRIESRLELVD
jgi:tetrahydromethanopterin S-methyltransferase subunit G